MRTILTKAGAEFITPLSAASLSGEKLLHRSLFADRRGGHRPYPPFARSRPRRGRARDRRSHGEDGARLRQRPRLDRADRHRQAGADRARDEPVYVELSGDASQSRAAHRRRRRHPSARTKAKWPNAAKPASAAWRSPWRSSRQSKICSTEMPASDALKGRRMLVTSGPTREPIDPVRYISNRSSGRQGTRSRAPPPRRAPKSSSSRVRLKFPIPSGVKTVHVETAPRCCRRRKRRCRSMSRSVPRRSPIGASMRSPMKN